MPLRQVLGLPVGERVGAGAHEVHPELVGRVHDHPQRPGEVRDRLLCGPTHPGDHLDGVAQQLLVEPLGLLQATRCQLDERVRAGHEVAGLAIDQGELPLDAERRLGGCMEVDAHGPTLGTRGDVAPLRPLWVLRPSGCHHGAVEQQDRRPEGREEQVEPSIDLVEARRQWDDELEEQAREKAEQLREVTLTMDLCLRIGEMLLSSGAGAADVTATMRSVADHLGLRTAVIDVTFTALSMTYQRAPDEVPTLMMRHVQQRDIDYEDLTSVDHLVRDIMSDQVDVYLARTRMATIVSVGHALPRWAVTVAWAVMAASVGMFLGGGPVVSAVAALSAVLIDRVQLVLWRRRIPYFYLQVAGGAIATVLAAAVAASPVEVDPSLAVTANIIMLLAGVGLMGAVQDGLTGFYLTAGARLIEVMLATAGIIAGVAAGISVSKGLGIPLGTLVPGAMGNSNLATLMIGAAVAAAGFSVACYAPRRAVLPIALITAAAALVYQLVSQANVGRAVAAGVAAFFIGLVAYAVSGRIRVPPLVVAVPAIVPFLPGLSIYRGLTWLADNGNLVPQGILALMTAISVAIALASGVILGEYVAQPVRREARRLEHRLSGPRLVGPFRALTRAERRELRKSQRD